MPPAPKDPAIRQRTNKASTRAVLTDEPGRAHRVPPLFKRVDGEGNKLEWHEMTRRWWRDVWRSPMAAEYLQADTHGLYRLAELVDAFWLKPRADLAAEIRLQQQCFGLTPLDRRRLEWTVEQVESAKDKAKRRQTESEPDRPEQIEPRSDPRQLLKLV